MCRRDGCGIRRFIVYIAGMISRACPNTGPRGEKKVLANSVLSICIAGLTSGWTSQIGPTNRYLYCEELDEPYILLSVFFKYYSKDLIKQRETR